MIPNSSICPDDAQDTKKKSFADPFKPVLLRCLISFGVRRGPQIFKIGLAMGVAIGGAAEKIGNNPNLLVIMWVRLSQFFCQNLTNQIRFKKVIG